MTSPHRPSSGLVILTRLELAGLVRSGEGALAAWLLQVGTVLLLAFGSARPGPELAAPALWVGLLLASSLLATDLYRAEHTHRVAETLLAGPVRPEALFGAKLVRAVVVLAWIALTGHLLVIFLFGTPLPESWPLTLLTDLLGCIGLAGLAALFGARAGSGRSGDWLLTAAAVPLSVPLVVASARATDLLFGLGPSESLMPWLALQAGFDLLVLTAGLWSAEALLKP